MASKVGICFFYSSIFFLKSAVVRNESGCACVCRGFPFFVFLGITYFLMFLSVVLQFSKSFQKQLTGFSVLSLLVFFFSPN